MKKSKDVPATLVIAIATGVAASGCGPSYYQECRDSYGWVIPNHNCESGRGAYGSHWVHVQSGGL